MFAFQPPSITQPVTTGDQPDVIEVVGHRADQTLKIDRREWTRCSKRRILRRRTRFSCFAAFRQWPSPRTIRLIFLARRM